MPVSTGFNNQLKDKKMTQTSKAFPYSSFIPNYANGLRISNDATTPNTLLDVAVGTIMDSTATFQLALSAAAVINGANTGLNGIDTGALAASKLYAVHLVADPVMQQPSGCMISLSATAPLLPFGYSAFALIGYVATDASSHFLKGYWSAGNGARRTFMYDAPQATAITAGAATSYTAIDLTAFVPAVDNNPVWISSAFTPGAASRTLKLQPTGGTGDAVTITGQVTSVVVSSNSYLFSKLAAGKPEVSYVVSNAGDAAAINVAGYEFNL
jgi:hypothetical protein